MEKTRSFFLNSDGLEPVVVLSLSLFMAFNISSPEPTTVASAAESTAMEATSGELRLRLVEDISENLMMDLDDTGLHAGSQVSALRALFVKRAASLEGRVSEDLLNANPNVLHDFGVGTRTVPD